MNQQSYLRMYCIKTSDCQLVADVFITLNHWPTFANSKAWFCGRDTSFSTHSGSSWAKSKLLVTAKLREAFLFQVPSSFGIFLITFAILKNPFANPLKKVANPLMELAMFLN